MWIEDDECLEIWRILFRLQAIAAKRSIIYMLDNLNSKNAPDLENAVQPKIFKHKKSGIGLNWNRLKHRRYLFQFFFTTWTYGIVSLHTHNRYQSMFFFR